MTPVAHANDYNCFDLRTPARKEALANTFGLQAHGNENNRVFVHSAARALSGVLNFGGEENEIYFGRECTFHGEVVSIDSAAKTFIRGGQHVLNLQAFVYQGSVLDIGEGTTAYGLRVWVSGNTKLSIGVGCLFADGISIRTTDHHSVFEIETLQLLNYPADVTISDRVWIGQDVAVLKGVKIGSGAIIGAKSLVNREVPAFELWSGAPARMVRQGVSWLDPNPASPDQMRDRLVELGLPMRSKDMSSELPGSDALTTLPNIKAKRIGFAELVEERDGFIWPKADKGELKGTLSEVSSVQRYADIVKTHRVVVQAGGNCGIFPKAFSHLFEAVYTFEPDPLNFFCLTQNASAENVIKFQAALGFERQLLSVFPLYPDNLAGYGVKPGGSIPTMRIDDLALVECDLIQLDIEGSELAALKGASETIARCRPVIVAEIKELPGNFGGSADEVRSFVTSFGYKSIGWCFMDEIFVPDRHL